MAKSLVSVLIDTYNHERFIEPPAFAHDLLEFHALLYDREPAAAVEQGLLDAGEAAAEQTDDEVVAVVGLSRRC